MHQWGTRTNRQRAQKKANNQMQLGQNETTTT